MENGVRKTRFSFEKIRVLAAILALVFLANSAWTREDSEMEDSGNVPLSGLASVDEKNPNTALLWSLVGTAIPVVLTATNGDLVLTLAAWTVGPSFGYFYGGLWGRGLLGMGIRSCGEVLLLFGGFVTWIESWSSDPKDLEKADFLMKAGIGVVLASTIWDLVTVKGSVAKRNKKLREQTLAISPLFNPQTKAVGIAFQVRF